MNIWIKNTDGKPDAMLTLGIIAFVVVTFRVVVGLFGGFEIGDKAFTFNPMPAGNIVAYLGASLGAYVARRNKILSNKLAIKKERALKKGKK